jgi:hypothetical protein
MKLLRLLASPRLTVAGFAAVAVGVAAAQWLPGPAGLISLPLALLALNLAAALWLYPRLRRGGLGVFHGCLLGCLLLVAWGRLTHLDGRVPIVDGQEFDVGAVEVVGQGPWHGDGLHRLAFRQGPFTVSYAPGVRREHTTSLVAVGHDPRAPWQTVGDDRPLKIDGYRFYTTSNKGFAPVLTWTPPGGAAVTGAVMLPSYPVNDWQQVNRWQAPGGGEWKFALHVPKVPENTAWTLDPAQTQAVLVAETGGVRRELRPGDEVQTAQGTLRYEWLAGWMGYRIFYDPTLLPLLGLALLGVAGMAWHLWARSLRSLASAEAVPA